MSILSKPGSTSKAQQAAARKLLTTLRSPIQSLPMWGQVHDIRTASFVDYDPKAITHRLQLSMLAYMSNPPQVNGQNAFYVCLGYRQGGKSLTAEYGCYTKAAYTPGWDHLTIADTRDRADYLHRRVHFLHSRWPAELRAPTLPVRESRQLTFHDKVGGRMRVLSGEAGAVGIGQSPDSFHGSELPFWSDAAGQFNYFWPSMIQRDNAFVINEATPAPADEPSVEWWQDHCRDAKLRKGRLVYGFFPFWDGKLNARTWDKRNKLTDEELQMLQQYGNPNGNPDDSADTHGRFGIYLTRDNLQFRRLMLDTDAEIRRNPDLFRVFYPFDDVTCWVATSRSAIHPTLIEKHQKNPDLQEWEGPYKEFEPPQDAAQYIIGVDPAGSTARDHAAYQVLKVWDGEWTQVASFADHSPPLEFTRHLLLTAERYNNANIIVESNGVGQAVITSIQQSGYRNLFYEKPRRPGFATTSKSLHEMIGWLSDGLKDELILLDKDTVSQLVTYRNDKLIEDSARAETARGKVGKGRRDRHHWDKISALMMAVVGARFAPRRIKPRKAVDKAGNAVLFKDLTWNQVQEYRLKEERHRESSRRKRVRVGRNRRRK